MATRRSHQKSRHGCSNCKRRRVKCDETRPHCRNCTQRHDACIYVTPVPFVFAGKSERTRKYQTHAKRCERLLTEDSGSILSSQPDSNDNAAQGTPLRVAPLNLDHLELELQWIMHTHKIFARNEETRKVWEIPVLQEALRFPFLMHGILAISALHLAHLQHDTRQMEWLNIAIAHKSTALALFSDQLNAIDESNARAMMSFAGLAVVFSFASALKCTDPEDGPSLNALADILMLARGVQTVVSQATEFLRHSNFAPLFNITAPDVTLPDDVLAAFDCLDDLNERHGQQSQSHDKVSYERAIRTMKDLAPFTYAEPTSLTVIGGWAIRLSPEFLEGFKKRDPFVLVILAHFCVLLHIARENWCIGAWGRIVLGEIVQILDPEWQCHIKWVIVKVLR